MKSRIKLLLQKYLDGADQWEIAKKSTVFMGFRVGALVLGYIFTLVVIYYFGNTVYSMVALAFTLFVVLAIVGKLGFDVTLTRLVASGEHDKNEVSGYVGRTTALSFLVTTIMAIPLVVFHDWIAIHIFSKPQFGIYLFWTGLSFPLWSLIFLHNALYRGLKKSRLYSFYTAFGRFLIVLILVVLGIVFWEDGPEEMPIIAHFVAILILLLSCYWVTYKVMGYHLWRPIKTSFRNFFNASKTILITSVVAILLVWIDRLFVGIYLDDTAVGIYDVGARLALLVSFNLEAVNSILAPKIVELYSKDDKRPVQDIISFSANVSSTVALITYFIIVLTHEWILQIFGLEFVQASTVLLILGMGQLFNCLSGSVGGILQMSGHQKTYQKSIIYALVVNLVLNFALIERFGIEGVAFATFASVLCWNFMGVYYTKKLLGLRSYFNPRRMFSKNLDD